MLFVDEQTICNVGRRDQPGTEITMLFWRTAINNRPAIDYSAYSRRLATLLHLMLPTYLATLYNFYHDLMDKEKELLIG